MAILIITLIVLLILVWGSILKKKEAQKNAAAQEDINRRMAVLREIKAQKAQRRAEREEMERKEAEKNAELARIAAIEEEKEWQKEQNKKKRRHNEMLSKRRIALEEIGIKSITDDDSYELYYNADEFLDVYGFFSAFYEYGLDKHSVSVLIKSSSGASLRFEKESEETPWVASVATGTSKRIKSDYQIEKYVLCFCQNQRQLAYLKRMADVLVDGINHGADLHSEKIGTEEYLSEILSQSDYSGLFTKEVSVHCDNDLCLIEYDMPNCEDLTWVKEYKYVAADNSIKQSVLPESKIAKLYENLLYSICLRSIYELCVSLKADSFEAVVFNGFVTVINKATGLKERKCILSLQVPKERFLQVDLTKVDPRICFKSFKGVSSARLIDLSPVQPVLTFNRNDKRFVKARDIQMNSGTNLASMDWEDFEHLVRELFEMEFARNGGEVRVTQASRDGGVDAIVFDPDPLRGGKIVIQAKRYTNTVGVSAVRDLYGTVINEGANSGILITTSDYGHDSYEFAKDKPLKLLNGGHLLALLHKNGKEGYINIQEAKDSMKENF